MLPLRFYPSLFVAALTVAIPVSLLRSQTAPSNQVLQTITLDAGQQQTVKWTNISNANQYSWDAFVDYIGWEPDNPLEHEYYYGLTRDDTDPLAPDWDTTGAARYSSRIQAIGGAWSAGAGFYNYSADFGVQAAASTTDLAIKTVVLQVVEMRHPAYSMEEHLIHKHTNWWNEDDEYGGDEDDNPTDEYGYVPALAALDDLLDGYFGGPLLLCTTAENPSTTTVLAPVAWDIVGGPVHLQVGGFQGNYYSFAYQWDLSVVEGTVTGIEVIQPIIHSASTIGVQLDLGDTWQQVIHTLPAPPADLVATPGNTTATLTWADGAPAHAAYAPASAYSVKRAASAEGPWTEIATGITTTTFTDTGLVNGTEYHYIVTAMATGDKTADSASVSVVPAATLSLLEDWRQTHFGTTGNTGDAADTADSEGDGLPNLLEYALGLDPLQSDSAGAIVLDKTSDGQRLTLTFNRIADPDLTYTVEATGDLVAGEWITIYASTGTENIAGSVTVEDSELIADHPRRFLRLVVTGADSTVKGIPYGSLAYSADVGTQLIGIPLVNLASFAGKVSEVSGFTFTVGGDPSHDIGAVLTSGASYYIEITNDSANGGLYEGDRFDVDTAATIAAANGTLVLKASAENTIQGNPPAELVGVSFVLREHITLGQLLTRLPGFFVANDQITMRKDGGAQATFKYNGTRWNLGLTNSNAVSIYPGVGFFLTRTSDSATATWFSGVVRMNNFAQPIQAGNQILAEGYPVDSAPAPSVSGRASRLFTNDTGGAFSNGDSMTAYNPATRTLATYTYRTSTTRWVLGLSNANETMMFQATKAVYLTTATANPDYVQSLPVTP
ncbi:fibronectin type III domain-containing protein [Opitutaceae bacterium TAV1]|nr:fibronectin type III domain-containing protein [Opitutaceae bacterium TAV1]